MFNQVKKRGSGRGNFYMRRTSKAKSVGGKLYEQAMENMYLTEGRRPEYRPSSFPLCSILVYMRLIKGTSVGRFESERSAAGDYFTSVGTTAHENIQFHMGFSGKVFGDWSCRNRACAKGRRALDLYDAKGQLVRKGKLTTKNSTNNLCPKCSSPMEYVEKEINFNGLKGHIDCIIELSDGTYWVMDYKTSTKTKLESNKLPQKAHMKQIPAYCYVLRKKYKMKVVGFSVLYFSRDNPFNFYEHAERWSKEWTETCKTMIAQERLKFKSAVKSFKNLDPTLAIKHKPCKTLAFYEKEVAYYSECPMLDVCFNSRKLAGALAEHVELFPTKKQDRIALIETIQLPE